jgi:sulfur carrier protein ThiS
MDSLALFRLRGDLMILKVKIRAEKEEERSLEISNADTYETVLEKLSINPEEVLVLRNGKPVPEDEPVADNVDAGAEITIIRIISVG